MPGKFEAPAFVAALRELMERLPDAPAGLDGPDLSSARLKTLRAEIDGVIARLAGFSSALDPVRQPPLVFDPSDPRVVGELIGRTMLEQPRHPLGAVQRFYGSGVYAIYYNGPFPAYKPIRGADRPIYIGKADPANPDARTVEEQKERLSRRLYDHAKSVRAVEDYARECEMRGQLKLTEFEYRY